MGLITEFMTKGVETLGISPGPDAFRAFETYYEYLTEQSKVMNLTAISGEEDTATLHFLDCVALTEIADFAGKKVIDIGSGAGFPGMPLKIVQPTMKLTMLDALRKRTDFLARLCEETGVKADCVHARAEEQSLKAGWRDSFDFAVSRAVANLSMLCELCLPFVKVGGAMLAMKSVDSEEEINSAKSAIKALGGKIEKVVDYTVPLTDVTHRVVIIRKESPTPKGLPRRFAKIQKEPL